MPVGIEFRFGSEDVLGYLFRMASNMIPFGWHESLLTDSVLKSLPPELAPEFIHKEGLNGDALRGLLTIHLQKLIAGSFEELDVAEQIALCQKLLVNLESHPGEALEELPQWNHDSKEPLAWLLRAVLNPALYEARQAKELSEARLPRTGFSFSELFTGSTRSLSLDDELRREILTAQRIEILVSFIRWSGLRLLHRSLEQAAESGVEIRILTTTYLGATEQKAIEELAKLPHTQVRISYNQSRGRLHAKGWIFGRATQLGTAYVGSSNLSRDALQDGLEWNLKITQRQNALVFKRIHDTFEALWKDPEFELFDASRDGNRLREALLGAQFTRDSVRLRDLPPDLQAQVRDHFDLQKQQAAAVGILPSLRPFPFQEEILERLQAERTLHGRTRNLVVLPTGSGKTMVAAFDYVRLCEREGRKPRLLFVAHRRELLTQARSAFARVLKAPDFGELWTGEDKPSQWTHLFASVQTIQAYEDEFRRRWPSQDWFEVVVVDEAHHGAAESYQMLLQELKPRILLGLTATPERMDGDSIAQDFHDTFAAEMRLHDGISKNLLCPFHYFAIAEGMPDLSQVEWRGGRYVGSDLEHHVLKQGYLESVLEAVRRTVAQPHHVHALGFCCTRKHAEFMAAGFLAAGLRAAVLTGDSKPEDRCATLTALEQGKIQYLFSVDLFNEGLDIPVLDTVLFLRPTESLTIFLQQLGRGLRYCPGKDVLTVLDFVSQSHRDYDFSHKFTAMLGSSKGPLPAELEKGFPSLPPGCAIQLEKRAQEVILQHIARQIPSNHRKMVDLVQRSGCSDVEAFLRHYPIAPEQLLKHGGLWYQIQRGLETPPEEGLCRFVRDIVLRVSSTHQLQIWEEALETREAYALGSASDWICQEWSAYAGTHWTSGQKMWDWLLADPDRHQEVLWWLRRQRHATDVLEIHFGQNLAWRHLRIFGAYTQKGIKWTMGRASFGKADVSQAGVERLAKQDGTTEAWILYVNVKKSEKEFSRSTLYQDWALTERLFQWESPNNWVQRSGQGKRFLTEVQGGVPVLLFVRETKRDEWGRLVPYTFLGPVTLDPGSVEEERPISMRFELPHPMPMAFFRKVCLEIVA